MNYHYHKEQGHPKQSRTEDCVSDPSLVPEPSPVLPQCKPSAKNTRHVWMRGSPRTAARPKLGKGTQEPLRGQVSEPDCQAQDSATLGKGLSPLQTGQDTSPYQGLSCRSLMCAHTNITTAIGIKSFMTLSQNCDGHKDLSLCFKELHLLQ